MEETKLLEKPLNEALELAKELGLKRQIEILEYEEWRKGIPYNEVLPDKIREELVKLMTDEQKRKLPAGVRLGLAQIKVENYEEKLPMSVLIRMKEAKEYGFDEFQIWRLEPKVDPVLVGVKYEGEEEVNSFSWQSIPVGIATSAYDPQSNSVWVTTDDIDHSGKTWYDGGSPEPKKVTRKVKPHYFELARWV